MIIFLNGQYVPEEKAVVSVFDRGFLYGDGLFEAVRFCNGKPFRWKEHLERFANGAAFLKIPVPFKMAELREQIIELVRRNEMKDALVRISLSRGIGPRGYSPKNATRQTFVMTAHPSPDLSGKTPPLWSVVIASLKLPANEPLAQFKNCNKLPQILARAEADAAGAEEALLMNTDGHVVEGSTSNLFWIDEDVVCTPPLNSGVLPGVTRLVVFEICRKLGVQTREVGITPEKLKQTNGAFLSMSSWGIVEIGTIDRAAVARCPLAGTIQEVYQTVLIEECR